MATSNPKTLAKAPPGTAGAVVYGPVSLVRPVPSREVSIITVEVPEEMHVEVTNLLYGRDAMINVTHIKGAAYGVLNQNASESDRASNATQEMDEEALSINSDASEQDHSAGPLSSNMVYGRVCGVKAIMSRGISCISIEVPEECHVEVTQMLYGREVILVPVNLAVQTPYGVVCEPGSTVHKPNAKAITTSAFGEPVSASSLTAQTPRQSQAHKTSHVGRNTNNPFAALARRSTPTVRENLTRKYRNVDIASYPNPENIDLVKWSVLRCKEKGFQEFMKAVNEEDAIQSVKDLCEIESRSEINSDFSAKARFIEYIYTPYMENRSDFAT
jgi:hypothetical protein